MTAPNPWLFLRRAAPAKFAVIAVIFIIAVAFVRSLSLGSLAEVDASSAEIRNRWLDSIQILGNLRHHVARLRTEEAELVLSQKASGMDAAIEDVQRNLDASAQDIREYRTVPHDADETAAFNDFQKNWDAHIKSVQDMVSLSQGQQTQAATAVFHGDAHVSFRDAGSKLRHLIDLTHTKANAAREAAAKSISRAQWFISDLILATLALFAGLALYLWKSFSRPLLDLAGLMHRLSSNDTSFAIPFKDRKDEVGEMARSLAVLRRNASELLESRKSLAMQAEILAGTLEKERALAKEQHNFLTTISHEFRTPLTYIDGHAQRLIATKERASPDQIADRAGRIRSAVFQMTSLVANFTEEMEMIQSTVEVHKLRVDLSRMLHELIEYYRKIGLGISLEEQLDRGKEVLGDARLLRCAFSNLISNAIKYSPEGETIKVTTRAKEGIIELVVEDHGIGIPAKDVQRVRERFYRGSNVGAIPGTGVGLSLVEQIIDQHGGQLHIESEPSRGTKVRVTLPLESAAALEEIHA
jgi:two-component system, OmpR family, sensor kinase